MIIEAAQRNDFHIQEITSIVILLRSILYLSL